MPGTRCLGRAVGSTVDPKIACLNKRLLRLSQGGSLVPGGTESVPKDDMPGDCVTLIRRLTAVRTVVCSPKRARCVLAEAGTVVRSWATANRSLSPGREAELGPGGLARAEDRSRPRPWLEATSATTDQVALEALGLLQLAGYPKIPRAETASRFGQPGSAAVRVGRPEGLAALLQWSHSGTTISVRFRRSRRSTPSDRSDGLWAHLATLPESSSVESPHEWGACLRRGRVLPVPPKRQPARGRMTRERVRCVREL
jgi:hypothetical protein